MSGKATILYILYDSIKSRGKIYLNRFGSVTIQHPHRNSTTYSRGASPDSRRRRGLVVEGATDTWLSLDVGTSISINRFRELIIIKLMDKLL